MRESNRLTQKKIEAARRTATQQSKPIVLNDGAGLRLKIGPTGNGRWVLRITDKKGKPREPGLGSDQIVSLAMARELAHERRQTVVRGEDPVAYGRAARRGVVTFQALAEDVHRRRLKIWGNTKHQAQWLSTLRTYAFPVIGKIPVGEVQIADVLKVLLAIWNKKEETARRVRQRISLVLDTAVVEGLRTLVNAADAAGPGLPKQSGQVRHHPAVPWPEIPSFITAVRGSRSGLAARLGFEFLLLTAARTGEVIYAEWNEIDFAAKIWRVPAARMKKKRVHRVPLSNQTLEILYEARARWPHGQYIFPGRFLRAPMSDATFERLLKRLPRGEVPHGLRSSFRDWCRDNGKDRDCAEAALSHPVRNKTEAAYARSDLLEARRPLMQEWADFACPAPAHRADKLAAHVAVSQQRAPLLNARGGRRAMHVPAN